MEIHIWDFIAPNVMPSSQTERKIVITGPGRSGTTFLMELLHELGYDTGEGTILKDQRAGWEYDQIDFSSTPEEVKLQLSQAPRILKAPDFSMILKGILGAGVIDIEHMIVPVRNLREAAKSRLSVGLDYMSNGTVDDQESVHAMMLGKCIEASVIFGIPLTIFHFPRIVEDPDYLYKGLIRTFPALDKHDFFDAFQKTAKPDKIKT